MKNFEISGEIKIAYEKQIKILRITKKSNISFINEKKIKEYEIGKKLEIEFKKQTKAFKDLCKKFIISFNYEKQKKEIQNLNINLEMLNGHNGANKEEEETDYDRMMRGDDVEEEIINPKDSYLKNRSNTTYESSKKMQIDINGSYKADKDNGKNGKNVKKRKKK